MANEVLEVLRALPFVENLHPGNIGRLAGWLQAARVRLLDVYGPEERGS